MKKLLLLLLCVPLIGFGQEPVPAAPDIHRDIITGVETDKEGFVSIKDLIKDFHLKDRWDRKLFIKGFMLFIYNANGDSLFQFRQNGKKISKKAIERIKNLKKNDTVRIIVRRYYTKSGDSHPEDIHEFLFKIK